MREAGKILNELLYLVFDNTRAGVSLLELEAIAHDFISKKNVKGSFKGYNGFPANLCLSVNDCVVHGIPDKYVLRDGDVIKIDSGITYNHMIADAAITVIVGGAQKNPKGMKLIHATKRALDEGITVIKNQAPLSLYSQRVFDTIKKSGFKVIENLAGHGVGTSLHEAPSVSNNPDRSMKNIIALTGMTLALEPITAIQSMRAEEKPGRPRNLYTRGDLSAQREYTVVVTDTGVEILAGITESLQ